jgi:hypothetical protein
MNSSAPLMGGCGDFHQQRFSAKEPSIMPGDSST